MYRRLPTLRPGDTRHHCVLIAWLPTIAIYCNTLEMVVFGRSDEFIEVKYHNKHGVRLIIRMRYRNHLWSIEGVWLSG